MKSTFRVLFFLKRDKVKKNGNMPIMARITIDGKLAQFNTKLEVNPKNWQAKTGKVSGRGAEFTRMNEMLDGIMLPPKRYATPFWARRKRLRPSCKCSHSITSNMH